MPTPPWRRAETRRDQERPDPTGEGRRVFTRQAGLHQVKFLEGFKDPARREARSATLNFVTKGQSPDIIARMSAAHHSPHTG